MVKLENLSTMPLNNYSGEGHNCLTLLHDEIVCFDDYDKIVFEIAVSLRFLERKHRGDNDE